MYVRRSPPNMSLWPQRRSRPTWPTSPPWRNGQAPTTTVRSSKTSAHGIAFPQSKRSSAIPLPPKSRPSSPAVLPSGCITTICWSRNLAPANAHRGTRISRTTTSMAPRTPACGSPSTRSPGPQPWSSSLTHIGARGSCLGPFSMNKPSGFLKEAWPRCPTLLPTQNGGRSLAGSSNRAMPSSSTWWPCTAQLASMAPIAGGCCPCVS